jgi:hypothetical protein
MNSESEALAIPGGGQLTTTPVQRVQGGYVTAVAVQKPRTLPGVQKRLEEEATLAGERFYYGWGAGKERIEGPSVKLALAAVRCWGNCSVELLPVQETADAWIFTAAFVDYETGFTLQRQFRQAKKWAVFGRHDEARKEDIRFQIGQSKAIRNVVINAIPVGLTDRAMDVAKDGARAKLEKYIDGIDKRDGKGRGIVFAVEMVLKGLAKHGATEADVLRKLEVADRKAIDVDRLLLLRGDLAALDAGEEYKDDLFPPTKSDQLAGKLGAGKPPPPVDNGIDEPPLRGELFDNASSNDH